MMHLNKTIHGVKSKAPPKYFPRKTAKLSKYEFIKELFLKLYKTLVRTHTDYGNSIWYPITKKNKQAIENLQRRATKKFARD